MKNIHQIALGVAALIGFSFNSFAQESNMEFGYNTQSIRPIHEQDQMYRKTMWYRVDMKEKQNKPFMAKNNELTRAIIEAVKAGILRPFLNDSLTTRMSYEQFVQNLAIPGASIDEESGFEGMEDETWETDPWGPSGETPAEPVAVSNEFFPKDLKILEIKEDLIFDRKRSRMYHDIQAITIYIPAELNPTGLEKAVASFSYKELVDNVFKDNPQATWYNNQNPKENRNFAEAFELRLFAGHLVKYSNSEDNIVADVYGEGKAGIVASLQLEHAMVEYESNMWEN